MKKNMFLAAFLAVFSCALYGQTVVTGATSGGSAQTAMSAGPYTVATLPTGQQKGTLANVSNGNSATDCTAGSGTTLVTCYYTGSAWAAFLSAGSMIYPGAGIGVSSGAAWGTSLTKYGSAVGVATSTDPGATAEVPMVADGTHGQKPSASGALGTAAFTAASAYDTSGAAAARQANLSILAGTYTNGDLCTYVSSGTLLNCNTAVPSAYSLPTATSSVLGGVKPDGTSILNTAGVISATASSVGADASGAAATAQSTAETYAQSVNTSGTASNVSGTPALPNGTMVTTQAPGDSSAKAASDAFVAAAIAAGGNATSVNGASVPTSQGLVGTNSGGQFVAGSSSFANSLLAYGAACDGSTDDTAAFTAAEAATANVAIPNGSGACMIKSNKTLNATYWFMAGGTLGVSTGVTVTMNASPQAPITQIFTLSGTGAVTLNNTATAYPEWFGSTGSSGSYTDQVPFNKAVNALAQGTVVLTKPNYYGCGFNVNKSYINVHGTGGYRGQSINCNAATGDIFTVVGTGPNCVAGATYFNDIDGFSLRRSVYSTSGKGFNLTDSCWVSMHNVESWDSVSNYYLNGTANLWLYDSTAIFTNTNGTVGVGVEYDGTTIASDSNRLGPHLTVASTFGAQIAVKGLYVHGPKINDLWAYDFETSALDYGIYVSTSGGSLISNGDLHFISPINDGYYTSGIYINGLSNSADAAMEIVGGYSATLNAGSTAGIDLESSNGVKILGHLFESNGGAGVGGGLYCNASTGVSVTNATFYNSTYPVKLNNCASVNVSDNTIYHDQYNTSTTMIGLIGTTKSTFTGNTLYGYATNGITLDSASNKNHFAANSIDTTFITNASIDSGTFNIWDTRMWTPSITIGTPQTTSQTVLLYTLPTLTATPYTVTIPANCAGSSFVDIATATASTTFTVKKGSTTVCTGTIAASGSTISWSTGGSTTTLVGGDTLSVIYSGDATLTGGVTIAGSY